MAGPARGTIEAAHAKLAESLMPIPEVAAVAIGESRGKPCLRVYLAHAAPELRARVPDSVDGYPVRISESGDVTAPPSG